MITAQMSEGHVRRVNRRGQKKKKKGHLFIGKVNNKLNIVLIFKLDRVTQVFWLGVVHV